MKFVICYAAVFFLASHFFTLAGAHQKNANRSRVTVCVCGRHQTYVKSVLISKMHVTFFLFFQSHSGVSICVGNIRSVAENCAGVQRPEVFEWIIGQMYGVNIGVVSALNICGAMSNVKSVQRVNGTCTPCESVCVCVLDQSSEGKTELS